MKLVFAIILVSCVFGTTQTQHDDHARSSADSNDTFNSIKTLVGNWEGSFQWLGTTRKGPMNARYYLTGNGSALVEDLISDGAPAMTTVYHLDGRDVRATHYCAAGNQPRLKLTSADDRNHSVKFDMIDVTNLARPDAPHVKGLELRLTTPNELTVLFTFVGSGKESVEEIILKRTS